MYGARSTSYADSSSETRLRFATRSTSADLVWNSKDQLNVFVSKRESLSSLLACGKVPKAKTSAVFLASTQNSDSSTETQGVLIAFLDGAEGLFPSQAAGCVGEAATRPCLHAEQGHRPTAAQSTALTAHVGQGGYGVPGSSAVGLGHQAQVWVRAQPRFGFTFCSSKSKGQL